MRAFTVCLISLALIGSTFATVTSDSATSSSFANAPVQVLDATVATNNASDSVWKGYTNIMFGPGATNATLLLWGLQITASATPTYTLTGVINRVINATQITNGTGNTATGEQAVLASKNTATITAPSGGTLRQQTSLMAGTAPGTYCIAAVYTVTTTGASAATNDQVFLYIATGVTSGVTVNAVSKNLITAPATVAAGSSSGGTTGTVVTFAIDYIWSEDGNYYVLYEQQTQSTAAGSGGAVTYATNGIYIQGVYGNGSALIYTTAITVSTTVYQAPTSTSTLGLPSVTQAQAAMSNYTNSSTILVGYTDYAAATGSVNVAKAGTASRTAGGSASLSTFAAGTPPTGTASVAVKFGGIWASNATYGFTVSNDTVTGTTGSYSAVGAFNGSSTANTNFMVGTGGLSATNANGYPMVNGYRYAGGVVGVAIVPTSGTNQAAYTAQVYYPNMTALNGSSFGLGTFDISSSSTIGPNYFTDVNGSAWFGYFTYETVSGSASTTGVGQAYIGRVVAQVNAYYPATAAGSALTTIAALLSFVIVSLFMF